MLKKIFVSAAFIFASGIFCLSYCQEKEAVIKLESAQEIENFEKIFSDGGTENPFVKPDDIRQGAAEQNQAVTDEIKQALSQDIPEPQAAGNTDEEDHKAPENGDAAESQQKKIKWLNTEQDLEEFNEILKKAQPGRLHIEESYKETENQ